MAWPPVKLFCRRSAIGMVPYVTWSTAPAPAYRRARSWSGEIAPWLKLTPHLPIATCRSASEVPPSWSGCSARSWEPVVTIPNPSRASIAPEAIVQFLLPSGPPSNWVIGGTRGKPPGSSQPGRVVPPAPGPVPGSTNATSWSVASAGSAWSVTGSSPGMLVSPNGTTSSPVSAVSWKSDEGGGSRFDAGGAVTAPTASAPPRPMAPASTNRRISPRMGMSGDHA